MKVFAKPFGLGVLAGAVFLVALFAWELAVAQSVFRPVNEGSTGTGTTATIGAGQFRGYSTTSVIIPRTFAAQSRVVRLLCTTDCYIAFGTTSTSALLATAATGTFLPALTPEYFKASPGNTVAVIQVNSAGRLHVVEMTR